MAQENVDNGEQIGSTATQTENFKAFATQEDYDNFCASLRKQGADRALKGAKVDDGNGTVFNADEFKKEYEKKYRKDLEASIRDDIEKQSKMTEAQKLEEERNNMQNEFKNERIEINKERAETMLRNAGFEDDDVELYLDFVNEDKEASFGKIKRICESKAKRDEKLKQNFINEIQKNPQSIKYATTETNTYQAQYDSAKQSHNMPLMSAISREAQAKKINLKY